jgi:hypothetical protein
MTSEKALEAKLYKEVRILGGLCLKLPSIHFTGLPDRLGLLPGGYMFFAEIKTTGKKPTKIQIKIHDKIKALGFKVYIVDSLESLTPILKDYERK